MTEPPRPDAVPPALLDALAGEAPAPESPAPASAAGAGPNGEYTSRLLVDRWLADRGVAYRVKAEPDAKGRTVYVLKECPFDAAHGDPDSCIMQASSGKLSAQCFHNSCKGRGWQEFKAAIGAPDAHHYDPPLRRKKSAARRSGAGGRRSSGASTTNGPPPPPATDGTAGGDRPPGLPRIQGNHRQLRDVTADALKAVLAANDPPVFFQRGNLLSRVRTRAESGAPYTETLTEWALRGVLARVADWYKLNVTQAGTEEEEDAPPMEVVRDLANLPGWPGVPVLEAVVECPAFAANGRLVATPGFHPEARLWYEPAPGLVVPPVPERPIREDVLRARDLLLTELLGDFPFADDASRAHALAALLLPFVRALVDGVTPLHLLDAPTEGTGKTLLASAIAVVATGRAPEAMSEGSSDEEWRKRLTALLSESPTFILLDNLNRVLDTGALAAVLTARYWKDRILGVSKTATLPNTAVWLASGNNARLSRELVRRTVRVRLDARVDAPWERRGFRHPNLLRWAGEQRGQLVAAALTLGQAWLTAGRPAGKATLGMFESWAETIGGILDVAEVPGLLANAASFRAGSAHQLADWRAFVTAWWQEFGDRAVGVGELFDLAVRQRLLDEVLGDKGERSQRTRLGHALVKAADRVYGEYRVERAGEDRSARQLYRLQQSRGPEPTAPADGGPADECEWTA